MPSTGSDFFGGFEIKGGRVDAVAHSGGLGAVAEQVAQVGVAALAEHLGAHHAVAVIGLGVDAGVTGRGVKAGPAAARVVLGLGWEEGGAAAHALEGAVGFEVVVFAGEGALGAFLSGDIVLFFGQFLAPFPVGFVDFVVHRNLHGVVLVYIYDEGRGWKLTLFGPVVRGESQDSGNVDFVDFQGVFPGVRGMKIDM